MATIDLFQHLKGLTSEKTPFDPNDPEHTKEYRPYIISRFISMCDIFLPYVNELNRYMGLLRKQDHRRFFWALLPQRYVFFRYIKKRKDASAEDKALIARYFEFGSRDTEAAVQLLSNKQIKQIRKKYEHGQTK